MDSNALHLKAFQALGERLGVPFTQALLERTVGMHNNQILPLWLGDKAGPLPPARLQELADEKEAHYRKLAATDLQPVPGVLDFVKRLEAAHITFAVGSSGPRENVNLALSLLGIKDRVTAVVTGSDISHGKPHPEVFLKAVAGLGLPAANCVVFEDATVGVQAALAAGCRAVAITTTRTRDALLDVGAHLVIDGFEDVDPKNLEALL